MNSSLVRTNEELSQIYQQYADVIYRTCYLYLKNVSDTEDMVQSTFLRLMEASPVFENEAHEKAWLLRTAINLCINHLRHWWRKTADLNESAEISAEQKERDETLEKVLELPAKYKSAIYLYYYEDYTCAEIAGLLGKKESTVRGHLHEGRKRLKMELERDIV